jgi:hypothetical protein
MACRFLTVWYGPDTAPVASGVAAIFADRIDQIFYIVAYLFRGTGMEQ